MLTSFRDEVVWLAGLWEGEGYFASLTKVTQLQMTLAMTDHDIIERAYRLMGSPGPLSVRKNNGFANGKLIYRFNISGHRAASWMMMLYPFLGLRRKAQVRTALGVWRSRPVYDKRLMSRQERLRLV